MKNRLFNIISKLSALDQLAIKILAVFSCLWIYILTIKYYHFSYADWDLAYNTQSAWNILRGNTHISIFDMHSFGAHTNFIVLLLLPIFVFFQHPMTLVMIKLLVFLLTAFFIYKCSFKITKGKVFSIALMFLYLLFPTNVFGILYDYHHESTSTIFFVLLFYFFHEKRYKAFIITILFTILIKENMPLIIAAFGIYGLFFNDRDRIKWGVVPLLIGIFSFFLLVGIVVPALRHTKIHPFIVRYNHFGNNYKEVLSTLLFHPKVVIGHLLSPMNTSYVRDLFGPLLIPSILSPQILFLISPFLFQHMLSADGAEHSIFAYYGLTMSPFFFLATASTFAFIKESFSRRSYIITACILTISCLLFSLSFSSQFFHDFTRNYGYITKKRWEIVKRIPDSAGVISTFDYLPELSRRRNLYSFHRMFDVVYQSAEKGKVSAFSPDENFVLPDTVTYALVNFNDYWLKSYTSQEGRYTAKYISKFFDAGWAIEDAADDIFLFKRDGIVKSNIVMKSKEPFDGLYDAQNDNNELNLIRVNMGTSVKDNLGGATIPLNFYWNARSSTIEKSHVVRIAVQQNGKTIKMHDHFIGYSMAPTSTWNKGEYIKENYWLYLPEVESGSYQIIIKAPYKIVQLPLNIP